jgi:hypothetical protein
MQEHYCHNCGCVLTYRPKQKASTVRCPRCNVKAIIDGQEAVDIRQSSAPGSDPRARSPSLVGRLAREVAEYVPMIVVLAIAGAVSTILKQTETNQQLRGKITEMEEAGASRPNREFHMIKDGSTRMVLPNGSPVLLKPCQNCTDPTWEQLRAFLLADNTDTFPYQRGRYVCANYAQDLCNRARDMGWNCGYVSLDFAEGEGHAINVFHTSDDLVVYVDCTGVESPVQGMHYDKAIVLPSDSRPWPFPTLTGEQSYFFRPLLIGEYDPKLLWPIEGMTLKPMGEIVRCLVWW